MDMRIPHLNIKILLESNPPKSRILARRLAVPSMIIIIIETMMIIIMIIIVVVIIIVIYMCILYIYIYIYIHREI